MSPTLQIFLLGTFHLVYNQKPITTTIGARAQELLAYLVLHAGKPQSRQHLAWLFWPDTTEYQARTNLRKVLFDLRNALPEVDRFLQIDRTTVIWLADSPCALDVRELENLLCQVERGSVDRETLVCVAETYIGELLPGAYADWVVALREKYQQRMRNAIEQLVTLSENTRAYEDGIRYAQRLLHLDPLAETTYQRLIRLRALKGDRSGALQTYHDCVTMLHRELGVDPTSETKQLYARILNRDTTSDAVPEPRSAITVDTAELVGRVQEWDALLATWQRVMQGEAHVTVITGEAGIGKTRLAEELLLRTSHLGVLIARTRSHAAQGALAYTPIVELLRTEPLRSGLEKLDDVWLVEISRLVPELYSSRPHLPQPQPMTSRWQRNRFLEALARAVLGEGQPRVLLFDDLQWCDRETLEWLHYLVSNNRQAQLLVIGTLRDDEIDNSHPYTTLQLALSRSGQATMMPLAPLQATDVRILAEHIGEDALTDELAAWLYRETEGNPLFVVETVRAGIQVTTNPSPRAKTADLPPKLYAAIQSRLVQLSSEAQTVARLAAVVGNAFTYDLLLEAVGQDDETLVDSLDELWRRRIIVDRADSYDFSHDKLREVVYLELSTIRRRRLHAHVARALTTVYAKRLNEVSAQIAANLERAGLSAEAIEYYERAASHAYRLSALQEAIDHCQRGLALLEAQGRTTQTVRTEVNLLTLLGQNLMATKGYAAPEVGETFASALALSQDVLDDSILLPIYGGLQAHYFVRADYVAVEDLAHKMARHAMAGGTPFLLKFHHHLLGMTSFYGGHHNTALAHLQQSLSTSGSDRSTGQGIPPEVAHVDSVSRCYIPICLSLAGQLVAAQRESASALFELGNDSTPLDRAAAHSITALYKLFVRDHRSVQEHADAALAICHEYGILYWQLVAGLFRLWAQSVVELVDRHEVDAARNGIDLLLVMGVRAARPLYLYVLAHLQANVGQLIEAMDTVQEAIGFIEDTGEYIWEPELRRLNGEVLLQVSPDYQARAEELFHRCIELSRFRGIKLLELRSAVSLSRLWRQQGKLKEAKALLQPIYVKMPHDVDELDLVEAHAFLNPNSPNSNSKERCIQADGGNQH